MHWEALVSSTEGEAQSARLTTHKQKQDSITSSKGSTTSYIVFPTCREHAQGAPLLTRGRCGREGLTDVLCVWASESEESVTKATNEPRNPRNVITVKGEFVCEAGLAQTSYTMRV